MVTMQLSCSYVELLCFLVLLFYLYEIHQHFFPYDVFWPVEPVSSNQSMENYTGEYVLIGHNVNHFQSLYFISQPPLKSSLMPSHFGFDKARRLHATSEIPNIRTKLSNNMKKHDVFDAIVSVLSSKENTSKDIKTDKVEMEIQHKCLQQGGYYILKIRKWKINMNVIKDINNCVQKLKVHGQIESKLNYANNAFNMELDILIVILIMKRLQFGES